MAIARTARANRRSVSGFAPHCDRKFILCDLVAWIEGHERNVPVPLKQYLKLGGNVLGFNLERNFGDCVDALLMVDLPATSPGVLARYMGKAGAEASLAAQSLPGWREAG